jgi:acetyltransferase EpsM
VRSAPREVFVAGTGSFAAEVADWAHAAQIHVRGLVEMLDDERVGTKRHGLTVVALGSGSGGLPAVLGVGGDRRESWQRLAAAGWLATSVVHPAAALASDVDVEPGATVGPLAAAGAATVIGPHAIVSRGVLLGHHVRIGSFATLNAGANIGGNTTIGDDVFVGMGATVVNGISVGDGAIIAAGAVVLGDVEQRTRVQGVPARAVAVALR